MKKSLLAFAVLGTFAGVANAQSTVTLYGIVDTFYENVDNGPKNVNRIENGGLQGSRIGFKGAEDLGGGTKAIFTIEGGFNPDTGSSAQGGLTWGRQAFVGLQGDFGMATLGRQYSPLYDFLLIYGNGGGLNFGNASNYYAFSGANAVNQQRINNSVKYSSPIWSGFSLSGVYGFGENATTGVATTAGNTAAIRANYTLAGLNVGALYQETKNTPAVGVSTTKFKAWTIGANYDFGVIKPSVIFQKDKQSTSPIAAAGVDNHYWELGATAPLGGGSLLADIGQFKNKAVTAGNADSKTASVRYDYGLSKRTTVYGGVSKIWNESAASFGIAGAGNTAVVPGNTAAGNGVDPRSVIVGVRHVF